MKEAFSIRIAGFLLLWILLFGVFGVGQVVADTEPPLQEVSPLQEAARPKIGLALGGGGAFGFAHIGVLQWLEENRIPVDCLAGTSIGGLIGGCYAMGMTPGEIRALVENMDWDHSFDSTPSFDQMDYRRKEDERDYPVEFQAGLRNGFKMPQGLGLYQIGLTLSRITLPYSGDCDFDELPVPFRCVAMDVSGYDKVVMRDGSLSEAMRATMAMPGLFTPVKRNGQVLVDGGLLDNVPVDVVKEMGAEHVIAVRLALAGQGSIVMGAINTVTDTNTRQSLKQADVTLNPDPGNLSMFSWKTVAQFVDQGYRAAAAEASLLRKFSVDEESWDRYCRERGNRRKQTVQTLRMLIVTGASPVNQANIQNRLKHHLNRPLDTAALEKDLTGIMGSGFYENIRYEYRIAEGIPALYIIINEKAYGPPFINFALVNSIAALGDDHVEISPRFRITAYDIAGSGSELRTDVGIGTEFYFMSELYKPLFGSRWFLAPAVWFKHRGCDLYENDSEITGYQLVQSQLGMDLGYGFGKNAELRMGYFAGRQDTRDTVGKPLPLGLDGETRKSRLKLTFSNTDEVFLAKKGFNWNLDTNWYDPVPGATRSVGQVETEFNKCFPIGSDLIFTLAAAGDTLEGNPPLIQQFRLGGPFRMGGHIFEQFHGNHYLLGNIGYLKLVNNISPISKVYLGFWLEHGGTFQDWSAVDLKTDLSTGLIGSTVLGPIFLGASYGEGNRVLFNFVLGHVF